MIDVLPYANQLDVLQTSLHLIARAVLDLRGGPHSSNEEDTVSRRFSFEYCLRLLFETQPNGLEESRRAVDLADRIIDRSAERIASSRALLHSSPRNTSSDEKKPRP